MSTINLTTEQLKKYGVTDQMIETGVSFDSVDLICEDFSSFEKQKVKYAISMFDIFGLGGKAYAKIADQITEPHEFFFIPENQEIIDILKKEIGPAKTKTLIEGINKIITNGIDLWRLIMCLMIEDCGKTIAKQFAGYYTKEICQIDSTYSFEHLQKSVIEELKQNSGKLSTIIGTLLSIDIHVKYPEPVKQVSKDAIYCVMTGSPKEFGYKTKDVFASEKLPSNWIVQKAITPDTNILITDDIDSKSSKMTKAKKNGIEIISYDDNRFDIF